MGRRRQCLRLKHNEWLFLHSYCQISQSDHVCRSRLDLWAHAWCGNQDGLIWKCGSHKEDQTQHPRNFHQDRDRKFGLSSIADGSVVVRVDFGLRLDQSHVVLLPEFAVGFICLGPRLVWFSPRNRHKPLCWICRDLEPQNWDRHTRPDSLHVSPKGRELGFLRRNGGD